jgi:predicted dehydrogenase
MEKTLPRPTPSPPKQAKPRLGFLGVGWIGRHRMEAVAASGAAEIVAVSDPSADAAEEALCVATDAEAVDSLDDLLDVDLDGLVIATPSALHAQQSVAALERGIAVFCQKPLARVEREARWVVDAAQSADRLLGVDLSYRFVRGARRIREIVQAGYLGRVYAVDLVFHNAYGPDKPWFYDAALSGGGCVIDLGTHLIDLALWTLGFPDVAHVESRLFAGGRPIPRPNGTVEDYAVARIDLADGTAVRLACSWNLPVGRDAAIEATFYGTEGGASLRNVDGSFYDFTAERFHGTQRETLAKPPDDWGGRAAVAWAERLAHDSTFDPEAERHVALSAVIDRIYNR